MDRNEISFENRPKAVAHLRSEVAEIKTLVEKGQTPAVTPKRIPIGIEEACQLIGKAKFCHRHIGEFQCIHWKSQK